MATWFLIIFLFLSLTFLLRHLLRLKTSPLPLPPSPNFFPFLGPLRWLRRGYNDINSYLRSVHHRLGPIISLRVIFLRAIFVSDRFLAHKTLVLNGTFFSDREEVVSKTRSFEKMKLKSEAEKCLTQGERLCNDKTEFENETYAKFLSVLNAKKAKLRALRDKEDSGRAVEEEEEATDKAESFERGRSDNEQSEEEASKKATTSSKARRRKRATRS